MDKNDWRLQWQEKFMKNMIFRWKDFDGKDHDHCSFCWEKFGYLENNLKQGYCSLDNEYWVCKTCFEDFKEHFNFKIKE